MDIVLNGLGHLWGTLTSGQLQFVLEWCRVARIHIDYRLPSTICLPKKNTDTEFCHVLWSTDTADTRRKRQE